MKSGCPSTYVAGIPFAIGGREGEGIGDVDGEGETIGEGEVLGAGDPVGDTDGRVHMGIHTRISIGMQFPSPLGFADREEMNAGI